MARSIQERREAFRTLHASGCFVIPNPWDAGSARALALLGFQALASTSAGLSFSRGLPDDPGSLQVDDVVGHMAELVSATDLPVNADFQAGYSATTDGLAANVRRCVHAGVAGLSIEDVTEGGLLDLPEAVERVTAAREVIDAGIDTGIDAGIDAGRAGAGGVMLTARAECFLVRHPDPLAESIRRLVAYAEAGADVLYAPGVVDRRDIAAIVEAVGPLPVNVLVSSDTGLTVPDLAELGVRRISVGSALSRVAWGAFLNAARLLADEGSFAGLTGAAPFPELNALFRHGTGTDEVAGR